MFSQTGVELLLTDETDVHTSLRQFYISLYIQRWRQKTGLTLNPSQTVMKLVWTAKTDVHTSPHQFVRLI